ncbi:hypothetical protein DPMN_136607 [Dreissena polymorpha]|uniref:EGF-like domain-containing protein n=1 Tax=Dreissena polymorpha TaxID=45954 RepID=A0A9D4G044_DREPO|nr:hypothetical protein DPMN_136607 [Dreissena polymorpha]
MFVDIPTTRSTVSPSATLVTTYRLTSSAARDTASPTVSLAETTASTASTVKVGTPSTLAPPSGARGTPTAGPVYTERRYPTASPHLEPRGSPTAAPPGLRKKRAVKETQCVINAICVASSDVYRCRCQTGYTADRNHTCHKGTYRNYYNFRRLLIFGHPLFRHTLIFRDSQLSDTRVFFHKTSIFVSKFWNTYFY